ncbi:membrane-associated HD superfamily phosphohydrolase [Bradyrhizobium sp. USDA 4472]
MIPAAIFLFLVGAVLAWAFRVWILVPLSLLATLLATVFDFSSGATFFEAFAQGLLIGMTPQFGYAFGLLSRFTLLGLRAPLLPKASRNASVALLYKKNAARRPH